MLARLFDANSRPFRGHGYEGMSGAGWQWRRGFIYHISLPCYLFMEHIQTILQMQPVTSVTLTDRAPNQEHHSVGRVGV